MTINTQEEFKTEATRHLVDLAVDTGRSHQSSQTGFVHYNISQPNASIHQTIPIYENVLFALALFRTRTMDHIKEGQSLIARILPFQISEGNFPVYLHEYPLCKDFSAGIQLLVPFFWILKSFGHVLGQDLRLQLENSIQKIVTFGLQAHQKTPLPFSLAVKFTASLFTLGKLLNQPQWCDWAQEMLNSLMETIPDNCLHSTAYMADLLTAFQMVDANPKEIPWNAFWTFLQQTWHSKLGTYCGPTIRETQDKYEPTVNLYDLYLGILSGAISARTQKTKIDHLKGALIHPFAETFVQNAPGYILKGKHEDQNWVGLIEKDWAFTLMDKSIELSEKRERTFTPFKLQWGGLNVVHSFVCQGTKGLVTVDWHESNKHAMDLYFVFDHPFESGNSEKSREICFYFDIHPGVKVLVGERQATTFYLGQEVLIQFENGKQISLKLSLEEGGGEFLGHVAQMNRPTQVNQGEEKRFEVYDWTVFLRTLRRQDNCRIKAHIELQM